MTDNNDWDVNGRIFEYPAVVAEGSVDVRRWRHRREHLLSVSIYRSLSVRPNASVD